MVGEVQTLVKVLAALDHLRGQFQDLQLLVFGQRTLRELLDLGFTIHYMGYLHDDLSLLRVLYSAADAMVVPLVRKFLVKRHRKPILVVHLDTCGLPDIVTH